MTLKMPHRVWLFCTAAALPLLVVAADGGAADPLQAHLAGAPEAYPLGAPNGSSAETPAERLESLTHEVDSRLRRLERRLGIDSADPLSLSLDQRYTALLARERRVTEAADSVLRGVPALHPAPGARLTSGYAARRYHPVLRRVRPHWGVDLAAPRGSPVVASAAGRVLSSARTPQLGLRLDIDHGNGFVTRYAHLDTALLAEGAAVRAGQRIGRVGTSGLATGPVLHYEVYFQGRSRDPIRFLPETLTVD